MISSRSSLGGYLETLKDCKFSKLYAPRHSTTSFIGNFNPKTPISTNLWSFIDNSPFLLISEAFGMSTRLQKKGQNFINMNQKTVPKIQKDYPYFRRVVSRTNNFMVPSFSFPLRLSSVISFSAIFSGKKISLLKTMSSGTYWLYDELGSPDEGLKDSS